MLLHPQGHQFTVNGQEFSCVNTATSGHSLATQKCDRRVIEKVTKTLEEAPYLSGELGESESAGGAS